VCALASQARARAEALGALWHEEARDRHGVEVDPSVGQLGQLDERRDRPIPDQRERGIWEAGA